MPWYRMPDGAMAHLQMAGPRARQPKPCQAKRESGEWCCAIAEFQCDWKKPEGGTCDKWLCKAHALQVAPDKHLCPEHQAAYVAWADAKRSAA